MEKRGYEFSFTWFFTIIVGAVIILLAVFVAAKVISLQRSSNEAATGKQIGVLLTPVETSLEQGKLAKISVSQETKILNDCSEAGTFGAQKIGTLIKSGLGEEWRSPKDAVFSSFHNKYLFSSKEVYGKKSFYVLSKPFKFPFKIADIQILWSGLDTEKYCFVFPSSGALSEIQNEISGLNPDNIEISNSIAGCSPLTKKVCFNLPGCGDGIEVETNTKTVTKNSEVIKYAESLDSNDKYALLYAAIFSDKIIYDCQVKRLLARASQLASLYESKSVFLSPRGCGSSFLQADLGNYASSASISSDFSSVKSIAEAIQNKNSGGGAYGGLYCKLF